VNGLLCDFLERKVVPHMCPHPALEPNITFIESENITINCDYEIYTDSSKNELNVGSPFCVSENNKEIKSETHRNWLSLSLSLSLFAQYFRQN
jgi:hypothetical protein